MAFEDPFGLIGQQLDGQFRVDQVVGEGGFSAVYRGTHTGLDEPIAIKCLKLSPAALGSGMIDSFVKRFRDEGRILYRLGQGNLNVVRCIASGTTVAPVNGTIVPYLVLEWLEGVSLEDDLQARAAANKGGRSIAEVMSLVETVADAMAHAHAMGVIHRDLSPGNIFLVKQRDGTTRAKVLDFGVAKVMTDDLDLGPRAQTLAQIRIFSPAYAAPEQFDSRLSPPGPYADVYSLALIAVELLTGRAVRNQTTLGEMMQRALDPKAPRTPREMGAIVTDSVEQVFARALSFEASKRQKDASELWRELRGARSVRISMDLSTTTRQPPTEESAPVTQPMPAASALGGLKSTVRISQPPAASTASQLFQPPAIAPPRGAPPPQVSGSFGVLKFTLPMPAANMPPPPPAQVPFNNPALKETKQPMSTGSMQRAQWLVGLIVFILVLAVGGAALRFLLLK